MRISPRLSLNLLTIKQPRRSQLNTQKVNWIFLQAYSSQPNLLSSCQMKSLPQIRKSDLRWNPRIPISIPLKTPVALRTTQKNSALRKTSLQWIRRSLSLRQAIHSQCQWAKKSLFRVQLPLSLRPSLWTPCNKHPFSPHQPTNSLSTSKLLSYNHRVSKISPKERHGQTEEGLQP